MTGQPPQRIRYVLAPVGKLLAAWLIFVGAPNLETTGDPKAIDRLMVRAVNFMGLAPYDDSLQNEIVVIAIDSISLAELHLSWPMAYGEHAHYLAKIIEHKPAMVAMDLMFLDRNSEEPVDFLWDAIDEARSEVPIFAAAPPPGLIAGGIVANDAGEPLPFYLGDITVDTDWPDMGYRLAGGRRLPATYPLAYAMFKALCDPAWREAEGYPKPPETLASWCPEGGIDDADYHREMLINWGHGTPDYDGLFHGEFDIADRLFNCVEDTTALTTKLSSEDNEPRQTCAYHPVIPLDVLHRLGDKELDAALGGKIVFYALDHPAIPDIVDPPTMRPVAGVHLHAMALDNLLTFGASYLGTTVPHSQVSSDAACSLWHLDCLRRHIELNAIRLFYYMIIFVVVLAFLLRYGPAKPPSDQPRFILGPRTMFLAIYHRFRNAWLDCSDIYAKLKSDLEERRRRAASRRQREIQEALWALRLLGTLLVLTLPGRLLLLVLTLLAVYLADLYLFLIPPVNVLNILSVYLASEVLVPVNVLSRVYGVAGASAPQDLPREETEEPTARETREPRQ
ncbi:MAG: hypothetical protein Kow00114_23900 [Kiloniellaceae bacterium]